MSHDTSDADVDSKRADTVPPRRSVSVAAIVEESAHRHADAIALIAGDEQVTYRDLWHQIQACAGALAARGVTRGTPVAVMMPNIPDFPRLYYAVLALGGIFVPVNTQLKSEEICHVLADSGARLVVCAASFLEYAGPASERVGVPLVTVLASDESSHAFPRFEDEVACASPIDTYEPQRADDIATILYTSGTTGEAKGAASSHVAILLHIHALLLDAVDIRLGDRLLGCLPLFHTFGQTATMNAAFRVGATTILMRDFDGDEALRLMVEQRVTILMGIPGMFSALLAAADRSSVRPPLRYGVSGGAPLPSPLLDAIRDVYSIEVHEGYGMTETSAVIAMNHVHAVPQPGSVGKRVWGAQVQVVDPSVLDRLAPLPRGELGEIVTRGHHVMAGYVNRPADTEHAVVDGWFRTGDVGTIDEDGWIRVVDRISDMIIRNAYNVYPREVEKVLERHPGVARCAVLGVPHAAHGQEVVAAVVAEPGFELDTSEVIAYVRDRIAFFKHPREVVIVDALPLGPTGKVLKRELAALFT